MDRRLLGDVLQRLQLVFLEPPRHGPPPGSLGGTRDEISQRGQLRDDDQAEQAKRSLCAHSLTGLLHHSAFTGSTCARVRRDGVKTGAGGFLDTSESLP